MLKRAIALGIVLGLALMAVFPTMGASTDADDVAFQFELQADGIKADDSQIGMWGIGHWLWPPWKFCRLAIYKLMGPPERCQKIWIDGTEYHIVGVWGRILWVVPTYDGDVDPTKPDGDTVPTDR